MWLGGNSQSPLGNLLLFYYLSVDKNHSEVSPGLFSSCAHFIMKHIWGWRSVGTQRRPTWKGGECVV